MTNHNLTEINEIKKIVKEKALTNIIIETGNENVFIPEENKFIVTKEFLKDADYLFTNCVSLKKIDMSKLDFSEITTMSDWFFKCECLEEIIFPQTAQCSNLTSLFGCFGGTNIDVIDLSFMNFKGSYNKITFLNTFYNSNVKKVILPQCKTDALCECFSKCYNLEEVVMPIKIVDWDEYTLVETFRECKNLKLINIENGKFDKQEFIDELISDFNCNDFGENCVVAQKTKKKKLSYKLVYDKVKDEYIVK